MMKISQIRTPKSNINEYKSRNIYLINYNYILGLENLTEKILNQKFK